MAPTGSPCRASPCGCRRSSATTGYDAWPPSVPPWCRGADRAPSTPSSTSCRVARRCPGCVPDARAAPRAAVCRAGARAAAGAARPGGRRGRAVRSGLGVVARPRRRRRAARARRGLVDGTRRRRLAADGGRRAARHRARRRHPGVVRPRDARDRPAPGTAVARPRWAGAGPAPGHLAGRPRPRPATGPVVAVAARRGDSGRPAGRHRPPDPAGGAMTTEEERELYAELVLQCAESVPRGRATTYGAIADVVGERLGRGGPRLVGSVLAAHGGGVPWWRVVRADGSLPPSHGEEARQAYLEEATPLRPSGAVDLTRAFWSPRLGAE